MFRCYSWYGDASVTDTIESFVAKLQKEGVEAGQAEAQKISDQAEEKARQIIAEAEQKAEKIVAKVIPQKKYHPNSAVF